MDPDQRRESTSSNPATFKFPSYPSEGSRDDFAVKDQPSDRGLSPARTSRDGTNWAPRKSTGRNYANGVPSGAGRRGRQKSLSEALRTIHNRRGSVTDNARELGEALKAPISVKLIVSV